MKREIKCKIWDEEQKEFLDPGSENVYWNCEKGVLTAHHYDSNNLWRELIKVLYTGFKTKDGTEIYEGDILGSYPHGTAKVIWDDKYGFWSAHWIEQQYDEDGAEFDIDCTAPLYFELSNCKDEWSVLGNVFEHPELLTPTVNP